MWSILTTDTFDEWLEALNDTDRSNVLASLIVLQERDPRLSRPYADSVKGSTHSNMKELRIQSRGQPLRVFFAFDPERNAILLCAGNKTGKEKSFYTTMIPLADQEFSKYLDSLSKR